MTIRRVLLSCALGLSAATAVAGDNSASSAQRAVQPSGRAITPATQQRDSAPRELRAPATADSDHRRATRRSRVTGAQHRGRFKHDARSLSNTIERRRQRLDNGR